MKFKVTIHDTITNITRTLYAPTFIKAQRRALTRVNMPDTHVYAIIEENV